MQPELCVIIVSWNVSGLLGDCLQSVFVNGLPDNLMRVVVVDNASSDDTVAVVRSRFPQVQLIRNDTNMGFTRANNQALAACSEPFVLLLNPDTIVQPGAVQTMLQYMRAHNKVGVIGPRLLYGDGQSQPSRRRYPTLAMALAESTPWEWHFTHNGLALRYRLADQPDNVTQQVDWVTGACMLIRQQVFAQVGLFDERFFMYSEELDLCRRITKAGWDVIYLPEAVVIHLEGQSSAQVVAARHIRFNASKVYYFRKHHGWLQANVLRIAILAMFICEYILEGIKWLLGHKRELRRARIKAYGQVIRSGLRLEADSN